MATAPTTQLTPSQQAYYNNLVSTPGSDAETQRQYASSLSDYQALASLDAVTGNAGREGTGAGTSGYDASKVLANAYGISGPITMGSGVSVQSPVAQPAYFQANPDVAAAYANRANDPNLASTVNMTPDQFAATHFQNFGSTEQEQRAAPVAAPDYGQMVRDAYGSIGRTGMGTAASNIDQAGFDYWVDTLKSGASTPEAFNRNFQTAVADYLTTKPEDQYSSYVTNFLTETKPAEVSGIIDLYQDALGRAPNAAELENLYKQFGSSVDDAKREQFRQSTAAKINKAFGVGSDVPAYFQQNPDVAAAYEKSPKDITAQQFAEAHYAKHGSGEGRADLNTSGILSGFKYANDSGLSEAAMKRTLGDDVFNTYKTGFADYAKTGIANVLADGKLSFDEARDQVKFGRDYGYDAKKLAELTGTNQKVFDAINKTYDDTTNKIVDTVLGSEDVKTDSDRIFKALTLQKQYGFTDEDLAKASDYDVKKLKADLDPVRNYEADYKKLLADPNRSDEQTKAFLESSLKNPFLKEKFGDKLQPALDELNRPPQERILGQIEQQRNALGGQYYQGVFSDPKIMAKILADRGVKSLGDLGEKEKFGTATAQAQYATADGRPVREYNDGTFGAFVASGDDGEWRTIPKDQVKATYGTYVQGSEENDAYAFQPLSEAEQATLKDGKYQKNLGTVVVNKKTGEELTDTTHELAFQSSSGGLKEKKNFLTVQFAKDGTPVLIASKQKAGLGAALQEAMPLIAMALPFILPGIGAAISGMLPGAAVAASGAAAAIPATLINQALTQGIISGGLGTLSGQDFGKSFLSGAISPVISSGIGSLMPNIGLDAASGAGRALTGAGTGVVKGLLQGGDFEGLLGQGVLSGLTNYGLGEATKGLNLTPQQLNFATGIALPLAQGQKVNPIKLATTLASATR
jgi:hypothetical protein